MGSGRVIKKDVLPFSDKRIAERFKCNARIRETRRFETVIYKK